MYSGVFFGFVNIVLIFAATNAQDMEECRKVIKALKCCRIPKGTESEESLAPTFIGDTKDITLKAKGCMENLKDLRAVKPGEPSDYLECYTECILNGTKMLTPDLKFNQEVLMKFLENDPEYVEFAKKHIQICEEKTAQIPESAKCKSNVAAFITCMLDQLANNCPKEGPKASAPECEAKNLSMEKCIDENMFL